eukprot:m.115983 g.115983  ORF g.115983 m.115983 type:complete len:214 (-) comp14223_c0_seq1:175-816(-)
MEMELSKGTWLNEPNKDGEWKLKDNTLIIKPDSKSDFWQKTYYTPELISDNGHCYVFTRKASERLTMQCDFDLTAVSQFDQAGLVVMFDSTHWIKTGIEFVDGTPRMSCVVTNEFSDWSTSPWSSCKLCIRVVQQGDGSYVVQAGEYGKGGSKDNQVKDLQLVRICKVHIDTAVDVQLGMVGCCPTKQDGCSVKFSNFFISESSVFDHSVEND